MSDKTRARRAEIKILFKGIDISKDMNKYLESMTYTDNEEGETDDISLTLDDRESTWIKSWLNTSKEPKERKAYKGTEIHLFIIQRNWNTDGKDKFLDCGVFEIDNVSYSGPPAKLNIKATSIPYKSKLRQEKHTKAWEETTLRIISQKMAKQSGLKLMYLSSFNPKYKRKEQLNVSDITFLQKLCKDAGISLKVTSKTIVLFDAEEYEKKNEVKKIKAGKGNILSYSFSSKTADADYTACHVSYTDSRTKKTIEYTYKLKSKKKDGQTLEIKQKVASKEEAKILAMKSIRARNKGETTAEFTLAGDVVLVAGVTVRVYGYGEFDGKYIVKQATHNVTGGYKTNIKLRKCLEEY